MDQPMEWMHVFLPNNAALLPADESSQSESDVIHVTFPPVIFGPIPASLFPSNAWSRIHACLPYPNPFHNVHRP